MMKKFLTKTNIAIGGFLAAVLLVFLVVNAQTTPEQKDEVVKADIENISKETEEKEVATDTKIEDATEKQKEDEESIDKEVKEDEKSSDAEVKEEKKEDEVTEDVKKEETTKKEVASTQTTAPTKTTGTTESKKVVSSKPESKTSEKPAVKAPAPKQTTPKKEEVAKPKAPASAPKTPAPAPTPPKKEEPKKPAPPKVEKPKEPAPAPTPAPKPTPPPAPKPAPTPPPAPAKPSLPPVPAGNSALQSAVLAEVNKERANAGVPALKLHTGVQNVALIKAKDMADNNYFGHDSPTFGGPNKMLDMAGISYRALGENLVAVANTPEMIVAKWMASPGHKANMLSDSYTHTGIGIYSGGSYGLYTVQIFIR